MGIDIKSMLFPELEEYFASIDERSFRAQQVFKWLHSGARLFEEMTNLPVSLRKKLECDCTITVPHILKKQVSTYDGTVKYLWRLADGHAIETVVMEYNHGLTVCISTQVGCRMGCVFCASAVGGFIRNLTPSEMLDQVMFSQIDMEHRISNIVLMGTGEPLDNFDNVIRFLTLVTHPNGINIGARHITLSTVGIIENIDKLAKYDIQLTLAASLHAADDETRSRLLPANRTSSVDELLVACDKYFKETGRRVSFEYALIEGINDSQYHAQLLAQKLKNTGSLLNLIHLNDVEELKYKASPQSKIKSFSEILNKNGIKHTIRRRLGTDIDAACGQLRAKQESIWSSGG